MIICDECAATPCTHFVEMIGDLKRRVLCPTCAALAASQYAARAKRRAEQRKREYAQRWATRRKNAEATQ